MKRIFFYVCLIALVISCTSNDDSSSQTQQTESNFYALTVGNKWVYKNYKYNNTTETYEYCGVIDSVSIIGTELINGNKYFKFRRWTTGNEENIAFCNPNGEHFELLRDSLGYLIRDDGSIKYMNNDYDPLLVRREGFGNFYYQLQLETQDIVTEAGTFESLDMEHYIIDTEGERLPGQNDYFYSDGIGNVFDTSSYVSNPIPAIERRLDSYVVQ